MKIILRMKIRQNEEIRICWNLRVPICLGLIKITNSQGFYYRLFCEIFFKFFYSNRVDSESTILWWVVHTIEQDWKTHIERSGTVELRFAGNFVAFGFYTTNYKSASLSANWLVSSTDNNEIISREKSSTKHSSSQVSQMHKIWTLLHSARFISERRSETLINQWVLNTMVLMAFS